MTCPTWTCETISGLGDDRRHLVHPVIEDRSYCGLRVEASDSAVSAELCVACQVACRRAEQIVAEHPGAGVLAAVQMRTTAMALLAAADQVDPEPLPTLSDDEFTTAVAVNACACRDAVDGAITDPTTNGGRS